MKFYLHLLTKFIWKNLGYFVYEYIFELYIYIYIHINCILYIINLFLKKQQIYKRKKFILNTLFNNNFLIVSLTSMQRLQYS